MISVGSNSQNIAWLDESHWSEFNLLRIFDSQSWSCFPVRLPSSTVTLPNYLKFSNTWCVHHHWATRRLCLNWQSCCQCSLRRRCRYAGSVYFLYDQSLQALLCTCFGRPCKLNPISDISDRGLHISRLCYTYDTYAYQNKQACLQWREHTIGILFAFALGGYLKATCFVMNRQCTVVPSIKWYLYRSIELLATPIG